ncbi:MAG: hypothetical protein K0B08_00680 [Bacteroidales bacterium]|nr:hypothetical protein [Bacteroidales bacterium]
MKIFIVILVSLLSFSLMAQEAEVLMVGENLLGSKDIAYSRKITISVTPNVTYKIDENKNEFLIIHFATKWYQNNEIFVPKTEKIYMINDPEYFMQNYGRSNSNWKVPKRVQDLISNTFELSPGAIFDYTLEELPDIFINKTKPITVSITKYKNETIVLVASFYMGTEKSFLFSGFTVDQKAEPLIWKFKLPPPSDRPECGEKYDYYVSRINKLQAKQKLQQLGEIFKTGLNKSEQALRSEKQELESIKMLNQSLQDLNSEITDDVSKMGCENLNSIKTNIEGYLKSISSNEIDISFRLRDLNKKLDSLGQIGVMTVKRRESLSDNSIVIREIYHGLKKLQWEFNQTNAFDSILLADIKARLDNIYKIEDENFQGMIQNKAITSEVALLKDEFDNYYNASIIIINNIRAESRGEKTTGSFADHSAKAKRKKFSPWIIVSGLIIVLTIIGIKFREPIKRALSLKKKVKYK